MNPLDFGLWLSYFLVSMSSSTPPTGARNVVRIVISLFVALLIAVSAIGWIWTGNHQSASQATASRVVLTLGMLAGVVGLAAIWRTRD
jgi:hypothetical protein